MLKITISVQDKKDGNSTVKIEMPKNIDKATDNEKSVTSMVYQAVTKALKDLEK